MNCLSFFRKKLPNLLRGGIMDSRSIAENLKNGGKVYENIIITDKPINDANTTKLNHQITSEYLHSVYQASYLENNNKDKSTSDFLAYMTWRTLNHEK